MNGSPSLQKYSELDRSVSTIILKDGVNCLV
jgi:hypothetical protein